MHTEHTQGLSADVLRKRNLRKHQREVQFVQNMSVRTAVDRLSFVSPSQRSVGCSARMEVCVSGPTSVPVQRVGWADFVKSVSI